MGQWDMFDDFMNRSKKMTIENARIVNVGLVPAEKGMGYIEIPVEKLVDGEVVTVSTKSIPIIPQKE